MLLLALWPTYRSQRDHILRIMASQRKWLR
jgi:hypothetical protein